LENFDDIREEALLDAKKRWTTSPNSVRNREPFGYKNFTAVVARLTHYGNLVLSEDPTWIGCHSIIPIIWYPLNGDRCNYELSEHQDGLAFTVLKNKNCFRVYKEEIYPTYSLTQLHLNYLIARGHAER